MKKIILILAYIIIVSLNINAQTRLGVKAGVNIANQIMVPSIVDRPTSHPIVAFHAGVLVEIPISKKVFFQPNLLFSQKGESFDFLNRRVNTRNNYLDLPLNIGYKITPKLTVNGGPYFGYLISSSTGYADSDTTYKNHEASFNYGFNANVAYELKNGFVIGANYTRGTINGIGVGLSSKYTVLNNVWGFSVIKFFDIKHSYQKL
jgi:hypothetical protein